MDEDEAALLAELRAISNQSSKSRFQEEDNIDGGVQMTDEKPVPLNEPPPKGEAPASKSALYGGGGNFKQESNFSGDRGGAAEDAELLALLRGVSAKSASADRFAGEEESDGADTVPIQKPPQKSSTVAPSKARPVVQQKSAPAPVPAPTPAPAPFMGGGNFKQQSTFSGDRGGAAEDEELLALLRGVSAKSSSVDRFADDGETLPAPAPEPAPKPKPAPPKVTATVTPKNEEEDQFFSPRKDLFSPPAPSQTASKSSVVAAPPAPAPVMSGDGGGFKQESTFTGERGGSAEDEELLALLKGISNKSADRFGDEAADVAAPTPAPAPKPASPVKKKGMFGNLGARRKKDNEDTKETTVPAKTVTVEPTPPVSAAPSTGGFQKSSLPNTFQGDRGGPAEDEELLALLKGISSGAATSDRFSDDVNTNDSNQEVKTNPPPPSKPQPTPAKTTPPPLAGTPFDPMAPMSPEGAPPPAEAITVTKENLLECLGSKDWKVRKQAYTLLRQEIVSAGGPSGPMGDVDGNAILPGLDDMIASTCLMDKNANALETAMSLSIDYADYCKGAMDAEQAEKMIVSLVKGSGFTCPRPSAAKVAEALVIKIMEVGNDAQSLNVVIGVLLEQGIVARKPKIVQMSCNIILKAAYAFGAASLPLAAITQVLPKLLSNANKKIRDVALEIVAELCRALGSKDPMEEVISTLKKAQESDLDAMLKKQPEPSPAGVGLRSRRQVVGGGGDTESPENALAALQASAKELEAERFAKRPAVNILEEINKTEYASKLKLAKWSEKVAGLKMILEAGGETPYKLVQPSRSVNYAPLISDIKSLLTHTHFAVVSKAMEVLAMLAQGVGERLFPNLRPLLPKLLQLSKDKKLTKSAASCLDAFFGHVLSFAHLLDADSAIPDAVTERKEKNALARTSALDFLARSVTRGESAGPKGSLTASDAEATAMLACDKLKDSDANVRKMAINVLKSLQAVDDAAVKKRVGGVIKELEDTNPRVFKSLVGGEGPSKERSGIPKPSPQRKTKMPSPAKPKPSAASASPIKPRKAPTATNPSSAKSNERPVMNAKDSDAPNLEDALARCSSLNIPLWDSQDEEEGVLAGLKSTKWQLRRAAINGLANFISQLDVSKSSSDVEMDCACLLVVVKEHTRGFKETNFNVAKAIMELFSAVCNYNEKANQIFLPWAANDATTLATEKIADKKLSAFAHSLLMELCVVVEPHVIHSTAYSVMGKIRAPVAHEEIIKWMKEFFNEFGASSIGPGINETVSFLLEECNSRNIKAKKEAQSAIGIMHTQLGPTYQALVYAACGKDGALHGSLEKTFQEHPYDSSNAKAEWPRSFIGSRASGSADGGQSDSVGFQMEVPKFDLFAELPLDCIDRMGSKASKTAWKARKAALEEVEVALKGCSGLLDTSSLKSLVDLCRELNERLSDTQSNLKPVAARLLGSILSRLDAPSQGKLGKVVYRPLISSAMNENKKVMHDAAMESLRLGTSLHALEGEGINILAIEPFVAALAVELDDSEYKAGGIADVLKLTETFTELLPDLDKVSSQRGETLGGRFAKVIVDGLSSSKTDTRAASESLLRACVDNGVFSIGTAKKSASRLKPAKQRSIGPILAKLSGSAQEPQKAETSKYTEKKVGSRHASRTSTTASRSQKAKPASAQPRTAARKIVETDDRSDGSDADDSHPLMGSSGAAGRQKSTSALRLLTWPEYPEEPTGQTYFNGLKKAWSPLIPSASTKALFPDKGIRRQDDAMDGCELLKRAITMERSDQGFAIMDQFGLILKWSVYVLCRKESTVGLQELLSFFAELFGFLKENNYELSDSEAATLLPFLFDKGSAAKGRFKDIYMDLLKECTDESFCPPQRLGPFVCVPVIESSSIPKARLMAVKECFKCVEESGLSGIGKKGTLAVANGLSVDKIMENRSAYLDLMELLLSKMNGDMQRLARICGASLSSKARDLVEERAKKGEKTSNFADVSSPSVSNNRMTSPFKNKASPGKSPAKSLNTSFGAFGDELPALGLRGTPSRIPRTQQAKSSPIISAPKHWTSAVINAESASNILSNLLDAEEILGESGVKVSNTDFESKRTSTMKSQSEPFVPSGLSATGSDNIRNSSDIGAAASLRARLLKIREKTKGAPVDESATSKGELPMAKNLLRETQNKPATFETFSKESISNHSQETRDVENGVPSFQQAFVSSDENFALTEKCEEKLNTSLDTLNYLLSTPIPVQEDDIHIFAAIDVLKTIHAAVSGQANLAVDLTPEEVTGLRLEIQNRTNEVVAALTRLIDFGFNCHEPHCSAGMSVPLLSVNLASLMAIFRSDDLATQVIADDLTILIREAGKALLDRRLASSSSAPEKLDDATSTQMVRAINKLAVQAATGAKRDSSIQALIALQQQLSMSVDTQEESVFNSRLSRVVTKLFTRVIKAEEGEEQPYGSDDFDTESILCCLEDALEACEKAKEQNTPEEAIFATHNLVKMFTTSILKARGESFSLREEMDELGIDSSDSELGKLLISCAIELGLWSGSPPRGGVSSRDVSALVSAVGSAAHGADQEKAIAALKRFTDRFGNEDLNDHLTQVSATFRAFILEQLSEKSTAADVPVTTASNAMQERIKNLRSKLKSTEAPAETADPLSPPRRNEAPNSATESSPSVPVKAFRARLAAAQEKRATAAAAESSDSAVSRAAALRARLQKVKEQSMDEL